VVAFAQQYSRYTPEDHRSWQLLFGRMAPRWERYANSHFLEGIEALGLSPDRIPELDDVNRRLCPLTGFTATAVPGYVPAFIFFDHLRNRRFPTMVTIRHADQLDYLPEPDIFHDIAGHVPMHTDRAFAETLVRFGECAQTGADLVADDKDPKRKESIVRAMARFFWFTIEFGLMKSEEGLKCYGSGLLSSFGEIEHAIASPETQRYPLQLEWAVNQAFEIDHYQPLLFWVNSFDHLFSLVSDLEHWIKDGKLNNVAP
jgi:phenylalanine-4-hydroxylase